MNGSETEKQRSCFLFEEMQQHHTESRVRCQTLQTLSFHIFLHNIKFMYHLSRTQLPRAQEAKNSPLRPNYETGGQQCFLSGISRKERGNTLANMLTDIVD
ncbi:hypothetical protein ILYODFUR_028018 [Ilyodon furcidens]|uniref:Uncharacterized protein n=1 Tax=Ilyodon furcidens TaxID=33524 RepID=A0ABV0V7F8_9TELE